MQPVVTRKESCEKLRVFTSSLIYLKYWTLGCIFGCFYAKRLLYILRSKTLLKDSWHVTKRFDCDPSCESGCLNDTAGFYREEEKRVSSLEKGCGFWWWCSNTHTPPGLRTQVTQFRMKLFLGHFWSMTLLLIVNRRWKLMIFLRHNFYRLLQILEIFNSEKSLKFIW